MTYKYYDLLRLNKDNNPSQKEIKIAYHKLAMKHHPDKNPNDQKNADLFKEISNAYSILSDEDKKNKYDRLGDNNYEEGGMNNFNPEDIFSAFFNDGGFNGFGREDHFGFNFNRNMKRNSKCDNIEKIIKVSLEDVYNGINNKMKISTKKYCLNCRSTCDKCGGTGVYKQMKNMGFLTQIHQGPCSKCGAKGEILKLNKSCKDCKGEGSYSKESIANLIVNAGFPDNYKTIFKGFGEQPQKNNDTPGDLVIILKIVDDSKFVRKENDLYYKTQIGLVDSIVGKIIEIPFFNDEKIKINTQDLGIILNNKDYLIENKGLPIFCNNSRKGNLFVSFSVESKKIKDKDKINELRKLLIDIIN
jgi:DnaJ-class molecular chaperone